MKYLFQGDSITDAGRGDASPLALGKGYANLLASYLTYENPDDIVYNCGISGHRIVDLYARWKKDCINLEPDVLTILIGVNDVWHEINESPNGVDAPKFEKIYTMLIEEIKEVLPSIKIMLMEPFLMPGPASEGNWDYFKKEVELRSEAVKRVAQKTGCKFVPLQEVFDKACEKAEPAYWSGDGVHPSPFGHKLISKEWIKAFNEIK